MRDPLVCLFLDEAARHLKTSKVHRNALVRIEERDIALECLKNAMCCRRLSKGDKLEILGIQMMIEEMQ